jgi:hypothetical protein
MRRRRRISLVRTNIYPMIQREPPSAPGRANVPHMGKNSRSSASRLTCRYVISDRQARKGHACPEIASVRGSRQLP